MEMRLVKRGVCSLGGLAGRGGRPSHLKRAHVMTPFIKTLHLPLKPGSGDWPWQVKDTWCLPHLFSYPSEECVFVGVCVYLSMVCCLVCKTASGRIHFSNNSYDLRLSTSSLTSFVLSHLVKDVFSIQSNSVFDIIL